MSYYDAKAVKDSIDIDVVEYEADAYHVDYELYDGAERKGIRFVSDYEMKYVTKNGSEIDKYALSPYAKRCIQLAIEKKHGPAISGI